MNFHIEDWYVDVDANNIISDQQQIKLESKVMALLVFLAQHPNDVISREQLEDEIWGDQVTGYDALTNCLSKLRKALGDNSRQPKYIETVTQKGYRLIAPVRWQNNIEVESAQKPEQQSVFSVKILGLLLLTVLTLSGLLYLFTQDTTHNLTEHTSTEPLNAPMKPSIFVHPFENLEQNAEQRYFSNGIAADIRIALSRVSGLQVVTSPHGIQDDQSSNYYLTGSVQREGNKLRVNVELFDNASNHQLWGESYNREITEIFAVQDEITSQVVASLSIKLSQQEKKRVAHRYTRSIEAYDLFLQGQSHYVRHTKSENLTARNYYQQAIDIDPAFARAYSAMATTYTEEYRYHWSDQQNLLEQSLALAKKAIEIDDILPQSYAVLSHAYIHLYQYDKAIEAANKSLAYHPGYPDALATLAHSYIYMGKEQEAVKILKKAVLNNPRYPAPYASGLGQAYYHLGQYENALSWIKQAMEKNYNLLSAHLMNIATLHRLGNNEETDWAVEQLYAQIPNFSLKSAHRIFPIEDKSKLENIIEDLKQAGVKS